MSGYFYKKTEPQLWTVFDCEKMPESDHPSSEAAARRVHMLNGGSAPQASNEQLAIGIMAAILRASDHGAYEAHECVMQAREIMETVYKTEPE